MMNGLAHPKRMAVRMAHLHLADAPAFVLRWTDDLQVLSLAPLVHGIYVIGPDRHPDAAATALSVSAETDGADP